MSHREENNFHARQIILTGDRPTGPLHLGHLAGSLRNRVALQHLHTQYVLVADTQALTDNAHDPGKVQRNVAEVVLDYLAAGIDPALTCICLQSALPALAELTMLYSNFVTVARLERNPTIKTEIAARGFGRDIPAGFLCYPISQAADITGFRATLVPVGADQAPLIELSNEVVRKINRQTGRDILPEATALIPAAGRLPGTDGQSKMSKSQGNSIPLSSSYESIAAAVHMMYTDPGHIRVSDPGQVEGNVVFTYLDTFDPDVGAVESLKASYSRGGLGDVALKKRLTAVLESLIGPMRERRHELSAKPDYIMDILRDGTLLARDVTRRTVDEIREALGLFSLGIG
jgi:tryptophanyl-tRNA synthetase